MALTPSTMVTLGTDAPDFCLLDSVSGQMTSLADVRSPTATVIMFICNHCPYVVHILDTLVAVAAQYQQRGVAFVAISANDVKAYPADAPDKMALLAQQKGFTFPYLFDESQCVARAYDAACTPDFFVYSGEMRLVYRGQFDAARPGSTEPVTGSDLTQALDDMLAGRAVNPNQTPSMGCNIKWRE